MDECKPLVMGALAAAAYTTVEGPGITDTIADTVGRCRLTLSNPH